MINGYTQFFMISCLVIIHVAYFYNSLNTLLSVVKWALANIFDWFAYIFIFHVINVSKLIYTPFVIRSLLLLTPKHVIHYVNVFIWYTKSSIFAWLFEDLTLYTRVHIVYIMHLNPIIVTLRISKCIQYIMLTMVHAMGAIHFRFALNKFYTRIHTLRKPFYTLSLKNNRYMTVSAIELKDTTFVQVPPLYIYIRCTYV